jgi:multidrug efflux pump subunit AcrA (membrane-fusion protein)
MIKKVLNKVKNKVPIVLITLTLIGISFPLAGCGSDPGEAQAQQNQIATVERGNLSVDITAVGNLALSRTEDLAFDLFYQEGTVEEVTVEEGDIVTEGEVLASLDKGEWDDNLADLQDKLTAAQRALTTKERALTQANRKVTDLKRAVTDKEDAVAKAKLQVTSKELDLTQAQLDVETAQYNLGEMDDVKKAQDAVDNAEYALKFAKSMLSGEFGGGTEIADYSYWSQLKTQAEEELADAQKDLQDILKGLNTQISDDVALEIAKKQLQVEQKQLALENAQLAVNDANKAVDDANYTLANAKSDVEDAKQDVENAKLDVEEANKALQKAQDKLDEANSKSPLIVAPFDGFITKVNVEGGDNVLSGTVAVQLADPNKFEAEIMVSEMDIMQIKEGGAASVQVDALSGLTLPAEVTHISPTATISQGVVNYRVKVEVKSLEDIAQQQQAAQQEAMQNLQQGQLPDRLKQAVEAGQITQEEAEQRMQQLQAAMQNQPSANWTGQNPSTASEDFQLREGLTAMVTIVVDERSDVLLVPNSAITTQGRQTFVQVVAADGTLEQRAIQTGISDFQHTEVTEGLSEGEKVVVPQGAVTNTTTQQRQPNGVFIPGMGGPR